VNIINTYTFILGAEYFSPQLLNASPITAVHYATKTCGNEATDYAQLGMLDLALKIHSVTMVTSSLKEST